MTNYVLNFSGTAHLWYNQFSGAFHLKVDFNLSPSTANLLLLELTITQNHQKGQLQNSDASPEERHSWSMHLRWFKSPYHTATGEITHLNINYTSHLLPVISVGLWLCNDSHLSDIMLDIDLTPNEDQWARGHKQHAIINNQLLVCLAWQNSFHCNLCLRRYFMTRIFTVFEVVEAILKFYLPSISGYGFQ